MTPVPPEGFWQSCFDIFGGGELCQRWYLGFVEPIKGELEKNECYQTGGTSWVRPTIPNPFRAACYCPGHAAIQVTMCDETTTFYLDFGVVSFHQESLDEGTQLGVGKSRQDYCPGSDRLTAAEQ